MSIEFKQLGSRNHLLNTQPPPRYGKGSVSAVTGALCTAQLPGQGRSLTNGLSAEMQTRHAGMERCLAGGWRQGDSRALSTQLYLGSCCDFTAAGRSSPPVPPRLFHITAAPPKHKIEE